MLELFSRVNPELVTGALIGLGMVGLIVRGVVMGWIEARGKMRESEKSLSPMATAMAITWDRDQIERALQIFERIAEALELQTEHTAIVAKAQGVLADQFQQSTQSKLNDLLDRLDSVSVTKKRTRSTP